MLRSTFAGFVMAQQAISANQRAIDLVGQNLSNIHTAGYTRQRLDLASISPVGTSYGSSVFDNRVGQGVMMTGISQIRDPFLDIQYRNQSAKVGTADAVDQILARIGEIFDETDSVAIRAAFNDVASQLRTMANSANAGEESTDTLVRSAFQVLINSIHQKASALDGLQDEMVKEMKDSIVPDINSCLKEIQELNKSIKNSQVLGNPSLELQDRRNQLLDKLSEYLPIQVKYKTDNSSGTKVDELHVTFKDADGNEHTLVSDDKVAEFEFNDAAGIPVSMKIKDALNPTGAISDVDVADLIQNGILKGNLDMLNKSEKFDNPPSDIKGIGYYRGMFDAFVSKLATVLNDLNVKKDDSGNVIGNPEDYALFETSDGSGVFTAGNVKISDGWMAGTVAITKYQGTGVGGTNSSTAYENIHKMINAMTADTMEFKNSYGEIIFKGTIQGCYDNIQDIQAIERKSSNSLLESHLTVLYQIQDSRDAESGVNLNEEVMDLMQYQQSYNAASRLMTTLDEMIDKLINSTGVVGR